MIKTFLRSTIVVILLALVIAVGRNVYQQATKFQEINQAENKAKNLEKEHELLKSELEQKQSTFFIEKQARDKLGFQKEGDVLYIVPSESKTEQEKDNENKKNWQKWVDIFF